MTTLEARIAEVLAATDSAHAFRAADYSDRERPTYRCACGVETIGMHHEHHRKALTAALLPMIREAQAEAWGDCVRTADRQWTIGYTSAQLLRNANPYRSNDE